MLQDSTSIFKVISFHFFYSFDTLAAFILGHKLPFAERQCNRKSNGCGQFEENTEQLGMRAHGISLLSL